MKIQHICEFAALVRLLNFLEAAEEMNISQATLSRHIKRMETELGVLLFERTTRTVCLTEEGRKFLPYAIAIQNTHSRFMAELSAELRR